MLKDRKDASYSLCKDFVHSTCNQGFLMLFFGEWSEMIAETRFTVGENRCMFRLSEFCVNILRIFLVVCEISFKYVLSGLRCGLGSVFSEKAFVFRCRTIQF